MHFDVAIVGLGAMGSASAYALARRGARVLGFDQAAPPHSLGSTHGHTRIIREAYYEHPLYVPLVRRAYDLWNDLQRETGETLMIQTGGVMVGPEHGELVRGALESARTHGIAHEMLDARALESRFPAYRAQPHWVALLEHRAGMLFPERCVRALLSLARKHGAELRLNEQVTAWTPVKDGVSVASSEGTHTASRLVVAAGPWLPNFRDSLGVALPLDIERQMSHWFQPKQEPDNRYSASHCPIGLWETKASDVFATLPDEGHGVKCGTHHAGSATSPESVDRTVSDAENDEARRLLEHVMPGAGTRLLDSRVCLYTNTPDRHFIIDWLAGQRVLVLSACSGHGFKFASSIGEIAAQLVLDGRSWLDLAPFSLSRFR
ncbi:MAG TPA: N-methyl-L-tryptophan oxidase [Gemmatimonadaceae bacterium]|jgi:sarcosine oxidase